MEENTEVKRPGKKKYVLSILFLVVLVVATCIVIFTKYSIKELFQVVKNIDIKYIILGTLMIFIYIFFEGVAMKRIFKAMNIEVSSANNFVYSAIDYYFCAVTPSATGGQPMVAYYMAKDKISVTHSSLTLLINTALFKIVLLTLSIVAVFVCHEFVFSHPLIIVLYFLGFVINIGLILLCFMTAFKRNWVEKAGKKLIMLLVKLHLIKNPLTTVKKFKIKMDEYEAGAKLIKQNPKQFVIALLYNFIQRIAFFSISFFVYISFFKSYPEIKGFSYFDLVAIQVLVALCVDSLPLPGGVGISEYLYIILLGTVYQRNGVDILGSAMILTRVFNFYVPLIVTGIIVVIKQILELRKIGKRS